MAFKGLQINWGKNERLRFAFAFSGLAIIAFASALDATLLGNALPVCPDLIVLQ